MEQNNPVSDLPDNTGECTPQRDAKGRLLPGASLNPAGKPKGTISLISIVKELLQRPILGDRITYAEGIVKALLDKALSGDVKAIITIINYIDGLPKQTYVIEKEEEETNLPTMADLIRKQPPEEREKTLEVLSKLLHLADDNEKDNLINNN